MHQAPQNTNDRATYWSAMFITAALLALVTFIFMAQTTNGSTGTVTEGGSTDVQITSTTPDMGVSAAADTDRLDLFFSAIRQIETGGEANPSEAVGDGGASIGPYQIQRPYYVDALQQMRRNGVDTHDYRYEMVRQYDFAERVMTAYWQRYNRNDLSTVLDPDSTNSEFIEAAVRLGRIHNGGPRGHTREATAGYGERLRQLLSE